jgi:hypothetical protein
MKFLGQRRGKATPQAEEEGRIQNAERPEKATQSHLKATTKPYNRHILGIDSGVQSHPKATLKPPQSHPKATPRLPQGYPKAPPRLHQGSTKATPRLHQGHLQARGNASWSPSCTAPGPDHAVPRPKR